MSRIGDYIMAQKGPSDSFALFDKGRDSTARTLASEALANGNYNEAAQRIAHTGNLQDTQTLSNTRDLSRDVYGGANPVVGKALAAQKAAQVKAAQDAAIAQQKAQAAAQSQTTFYQGQQDRSTYSAAHGGTSPELDALNAKADKAIREADDASRTKEASDAYKKKYGVTPEEAKLELEKGVLQFKKDKLEQDIYASKHPTPTDPALARLRNAKADKLEQEQNLMQDFYGESPGIPDTPAEGDSAEPKATEVSYDALDRADRHSADTYGVTTSGRRVDPVTHAVQPDTDLSFLRPDVRADLGYVPGEDPLSSAGLPSSSGTSIMGKNAVQAAVRGGHDPYTSRELYKPGQTKGQVFKTTQETVALGGGNQYTSTVIHVRPFKGSGVDKEYTKLTPADFTADGNLVVTRVKQLTDGQRVDLAGKYGAALKTLNAQSAAILNDPKIMTLLDPNVTAADLASDYAKAGLAVYALARYANGAGVLSKTDVTMSDGSSFWSKIGGIMKDFKNEGKMTEEQAARVLKAVREGAELQKRASVYNRKYIMNEANKNGLGGYSSLIQGTGGVIDHPDLYAPGAPETPAGPADGAELDFNNMSDEEIDALYGKQFGEGK